MNIDNSFDNFSNPLEIGRKIKEVRINAGLSQEAFSKKIGVSRLTIINWENGKSVPTPELLYQLCRSFGISVEQLVGGTKNDEKKPENSDNYTLQHIEAEIESISITPEKSYKVKESSASTDDELQTVKTEIGIIKDDLYKKSHRNRIIRAAIYTMIGVVFLLLLAFALILAIPLLTNWDNKSFVSLISFNLSSATDILLLFGFVLGVIICGVFAGYVCTKKISKRGRKSNDEK